jgi:hypothetical protein
VDVQIERPVVIFERQKKAVYTPLHGDKNADCYVSATLETERELRRVDAWSKHMATVQQFANRGALPYPEPDGPGQRKFSANHPDLKFRDIFEASLKSTLCALA